MQIYLTCQSCQIWRSIYLVTGWTDSPKGFYEKNKDIKELIDIVDILDTHSEIGEVNILTSGFNMPVRVAINGFGRIGRLLLRVIDRCPEMSAAIISRRGDVDQLDLETGLAA